MPTWQTRTSTHRKGVKIDDIVHCSSENLSAILGAADWCSRIIKLSKIIGIVEDV